MPIPTLDSVVQLVGHGSCNPNTRLRKDHLIDVKDSRLGCETDEEVLIVWQML